MSCEVVSGVGWETDQALNALLHRQEEAPNAGAGMILLELSDPLADPGDLLICHGHEKDIVLPGPEVGPQFRFGFRPLSPGLHHLRVRPDPGLL